MGLAEYGILLCLTLMFYQDLKYRAISWPLFPLLAATFIWSKISNTSPSTLISTIAFNSLLIAIQLFVVTVFFSYKHKSWVNITKSYLGWGDILFIAAVGCYLPTIAFLIFYVSSLLLVLLFSLVSITNLKTYKIPLAGMQAIFLGGFLLIHWLAYPCDLNSIDQSILVP